jgi:hypothetical protein
LKRLYTSNINSLSSFFSEVNRKSKAMSERKSKRCFENALSNRSRCRKCDKIIKKGKIRFGISKDDENLREGWYWNHLNCITFKQREFFENIYDDYSSIPGYNELEIEEQKEIKNYFDKLGKIGDVVSKENYIDNDENKENIKSIINRDTNNDTKKRKRIPLETIINKESIIKSKTIKKKKIIKESESEEKKIINKDSVLLQDHIDRIKNINIELLELDSNKLKNINKRVEKKKQDLKKSLLSNITPSVINNNNNNSIKKSHLMR